MARHVAVRTRSVAPPRPDTSGRAGILVGRHHQQRHQVFEHRAAPCQQNRLAARGREQTAQREPAFLRQLRPARWRRNCTIALPTPANRSSSRRSGAARRCIRSPTAGAPCRTRSHSPLRQAQFACSASWSRATIRAAARSAPRATRRCSVSSTPRSSIDEPSSRARSIGGDHAASSVASSRSVGMLLEARDLGTCSGAAGAAPARARGRSGRRAILRTGARVRWPRSWPRSRRGHRW